MTSRYVQADQAPTSDTQPERHASLAAMPCLSISLFTSRISTSFLWKIPAASAAAALVCWNTSVKCAAQPAPLLAITGMLTASDTARTSSMSKPCKCAHGSAHSPALLSQWPATQTNCKSSSRLVWLIGMGRHRKLR